MARMPGNVQPSWCPICKSKAGPDCPDTGRTPRQIRRHLRDELRQQIFIDLDELHETGTTRIQGFRSNPYGPNSE